MDPGILKHPDENQLYYYATETYNIRSYMYRVYTIYNYGMCQKLYSRLLLYHFTLARGTQVPRLSIYPYSIPLDTSPDTEVLGGRRTTIMMMTRVKIDIYVFTLS